jgi:hypothetical protein
LNKLLARSGDNYWRPRRINGPNPSITSWSWKVDPW